VNASWGSNDAKGEHQHENRRDAARTDEGSRFGMARTQQCRTGAHEKNAGGRQVGALRDDPTDQPPLALPQLGLLPEAKADDP